MSKLNDIFWACTYAWYGAGGHQSIGTKFPPPADPFKIQGTDLVNASGKWVSTIRALPKFNHRMFVDNWIVVPETASNNQTFTLRTEPTEQNFYFDSFFKLQKANGLKNIWSASGCFDWYKPDLGEFSQRKSACYNPKLPPTNPLAWADLAHLCKLIAARYKDNGLLDYLQILNEWDFRWNVPHVVTPQEYAVCFKVCYEAIRSVSATQKIMAGCTLTADIQTARAFVTALKALYQAEGKQMPTDWTYTVNNYIRKGDTNQGSGIGATPEEVDRYGVFFKPLNDLCETEDITWGITESGYNSSPSTSATAMKNKAPLLEGMTLEESVAALTIRTALICASLSKCVCVCFYHCKDGYEAEPFTYHGFNYDKDFGGKPDWSAKPVRTISEAFLEKYGEFTVSEYQEFNDIHSVVISDGDIFAWTDKKNVGTNTPMPQKIDWQLPSQLEPVTSKTIQDNTLLLNGKYKLPLDAV